jgi:hypothetical protein
MSVGFFIVFLSLYTYLVRIPGPLEGFESGTKTPLSATLTSPQKGS